MAWLSDWKKRIKLTIDSTKIDGDLANFPVRLSLNNYNASVLFDELNWSSVDDDFTAVSGSVPNTTLWTEVDSSSSMSIQSNALYYSSSGVSNLSSYVTSKYTLIGDFDIQADFNITTITAPSSSASYGAAIYIVFDGGTWVYLPKGKASDGILKFFPNSSAGGSTSVTDSDMSGKLRITRVGSVIKLYYWKNSQWEWNGNTSGLTSPLSETADVSYVRLIFNQDFDSTLTSNMDNFRLNSGTVICPTRKKIAVTAADGVTQCYVEIEDFDSINKKTNLWAKIPAVVSGSNTDIYLYCDADKSDNTSYIGDIGSTPAQNVWDENFVGVWHMNQDPTGGSNCIKDSTVSGNHGTPEASMTSDDLVDGKIGEALDFDGSNDVIQVSNVSDLQLNNKFSIEFIYKELAGGHASYPGIFDKGNWKNVSGNNGWGVYRSASINVFSFIKSNLAYSFSANTPLNFNYASVVYNGTHIQGYHNGDIYGSLTAQSYTADTNTEDLYFGKSPDGNYEAMNLDEVRISNVARSPAWVKATYYSNWDELITYESYYQLYKYYFAGYTFEDSEPVSRIVRAYVSSTGWLAGEATSSGTTGYYQLHVSTSGSHYLVCMDADELPDYNNLIISKATPYVN